MGRIAIKIDNGLFRSRNTRTRKYSEVVSTSMAGSVARSVSMAYPQFMMPGVANSYRYVY